MEPTYGPPEWLGGRCNAHRAIDDARGYAHLLATMMKRKPPG